jgi:hypothetical protein
LLEVGVAAAAAVTVVGLIFLFSALMLRTQRSEG